MKRALLIVTAACHSSTTATATSTPSPPPIEAHFSDLPLHVAAKECDVQIIAVVSGSARAGSDTLGVGDTLFTQAAC